MATVPQLIQSTKPEIIFSGRSNVGKSSLINKIANRKSLARTSSKPGKTITINFYGLDTCYFVDLPGYGYASASQAEKSRWSKLVEGYFAQDRNIALIVQLLDIRHAPSKEDMEMIKFLCNFKLPFIVVLTKKDKLRKSQILTRISELNENLKEFTNICFFPFSALNGEGTVEILQNIDLYIENHNKNT